MQKMKDLAPKIKEIQTKHKGDPHIVADGDLNYGLSRMYETVTDDVPTHKNIFRDMEDAQNWLKEISA